MSLKHKFISILTVALATALFAVTGLAQEKTEAPATGEKAEKRQKGEGRNYHNREMGRGGHHGMKGGMYMLHGLDLTQTQKDQIKAIFEANKPNRENMAGMKEIMMAKRNGTITEEQKQQIAAFKEQSAAKAAAVRQQIDLVLTLEQREKIAARKAAMEQRMVERKERYQQQKQLREQRKPATTDPAKKIDGQ